MLPAQFQLGVAPMRHQSVGSPHSYTGSDAHQISRRLNQGKTNPCRLARLGPSPKRPLQPTDRLCFGTNRIGLVGVFGVRRLFEPAGDHHCWWPPMILACLLSETTLFDPISFHQVNLVSP